MTLAEERRIPFRSLMFFPFHSSVATVVRSNDRFSFHSTYQALVDDVLDHRLNRVTVQMDAKNGQGKKSKTYDVDAENVSDLASTLGESRVHQSSDDLDDNS